MTTYISIEVPDHWTPEQAEACLDMLHLLSDALWDQYEDVLVPGIIQKLDEPPDDAAYVGDPDADDDIPF